MYRCVYLNFSKKRAEEITERDTDTLGVMEKFTILAVVVALGMHTYIRTYQIVTLNMLVYYVSIIRP